MSDETMQSISLWQPWAQFVALGWKIIETRTHKRFCGLVGKRIGIHAALKWDENWLKSAQVYLGTEQIAATHRMRERPLRHRLVCTAFARGFRELDDFNDQFYALIECSTVKRHGLFLMDVKAIEPPFHPVRGCMGIFDVPLDQFKEPITQKFATVEDFCR